MRLKLTRHIFVSASALSLAACSLNNDQCDGFYVYMPDNPEIEVPFSVEVKEETVKFQGLDYTSAFGEKFTNDDGSLNVTFSDGTATSLMECDADGANIQFEKGFGGKNFRLSKADGDIFETAESLGMTWGD